MDYYIKTDTGRLKSTADAIEKYVSDTRSHMDKATTRVNVNLLANWNGTDYAEFQNKWSGLNEDGSANTQMLKALESYANYLRYAAQVYEAAQQSAADRANKLP